MKTPIRSAFACLAALTFLAASAKADIIDNQVAVAPLYYGTPAMPLAGYEAAYALRLGTSSYPFPYVDVQFDNAVGKSSYARMTATPTYLTYIQDVDLFAVTPGAEISDRTISNGSFTSFFHVKDMSVGASQDIVSLTGNDPDIYLGFSVKYKDSNSNVSAYEFGWMHLQYTQQSGLTMLSSALTTTDAGIYAMSRTTISAVDDVGTQVMALMGAAGLVAAQLRRRFDAHRPRSLRLG